MATTRAIGWWVVCLSLLGCGPNVSEVRTANYPPNPENCSLEFIQADTQVMSGTGPWEVIGQIVLQEEGVRDPFAEKYRAIVRPRACGMGGEAVAIVMNATSETPISSGTTVSYGVLRKRVQGAAPPQKF